MAITRPVSVGTSLPSTCIVGQLFFNSSAAAGSNLSACTSANTWSGIGASLTLPLSVANGGTGTATPGLIAGTNVTISGTWPNQTINGTGASVAIGTSLPSACTVGQLFFNSSASAGSNLYGCTASNTWNGLGGANLTLPLSVANGGNGSSTPGLVAGSNITISGSWPNQIVSGTPVAIGTSLPSTCTVGQLFFNSAAAAGSNLYGCTASNTWNALGGASVSGGNATTIQGTTVSSAAPTNNQALVYWNTTNSYVPTSIYTLQNGLGTTATGTTNLQVNVSMGVRAVTATTDTIVAADCGGLVTYNNSSAVAVAMPQAGLGGNFAAGCPITIHNYGSGAVTLTPANSTIGGTTSQVVNSSKGCLVVSDGTNWQLGNCN